MPRAAAFQEYKRVIESRSIQPERRRVARKLARRPLYPARFARSGAGAIYPILYLRQVYQPTMLEVFPHHRIATGLSVFRARHDLSRLLSAERLARGSHRAARAHRAARSRRARSACGTPPRRRSARLIVIFGCWGLTTGLTFWAAIIKRVQMIAGTD